MSDQKVNISQDVTELEGIKFRNLMLFIIIMFAIYIVACLLISAFAPQYLQPWMTDPYGRRPKPKETTVILQKTNPPTTEEKKLPTIFTASIKIPAYTADAVQIYLNLKIAVQLKDQEIYNRLQVTNLEQLVNSFIKPAYAADLILMVSELKIEQFLNPEFRRKTFQNFYKFIESKRSVDGAIEVVAYLENIEFDKESKVFIQYQTLMETEIAARRAEIEKLRALAEADTRLKKAIAEREMMEILERTETKRKLLETEREIQIWKMKKEAGMPQEELKK